MEELLKQIISRFDRMEERFDRIEQRLDRVEERLDRMEQRLDRVEQRLDRVEEQLDENTKFIQVLLHRTEELNAITANPGHTVAKLEGRITNIEENMATKKEIAALDAKLEVLNSRLFHQEAEIYQLKAVK